VHTDGTRALALARQLGSLLGADADLVVAGNGTVMSRLLPETSAAGAIAYDALEKENRSPKARPYLTVPRIPRTACCELILVRGTGR